MTLEDALAEIESHAEAGRAEGMRAYHKIDRPYLGVPNPALNEITRGWRQTLPVEARVALARIRPDDAAWRLICDWVPQFDSWAIADHACMAGQRRLTADPSRIETVERWTESPHMWTRRAALVITLPWAKMNFPSEADLAIRDRVLGWAANYAGDRDWFIQKAVGWWIRDLSKHDVPRAKAFLEAHGDRLKTFARREAEKYL